jgi:hypothetical protein
MNPKQSLLYNRVVHNRVLVHNRIGYKTVTLANTGLGQNGKLEGASKYLVYSIEYSWNVRISRSLRVGLSAHVTP